jgi:hypothetical protein
MMQSLFYFKMFHELQCAVVPITSFILTTTKQVHCVWTYWFQVQEALGDGTRYVDKFRDFVDNREFFGRMVSLVEPQEPLAVLCHGDFWTNNILFRYSKEGDILEVRLQIQGLSVRILNNLNKSFSDLLWSYWALFPSKYSPPLCICCTQHFFQFWKHSWNASFGILHSLPANFLYSPEQTQIIGHSVCISAWCRERSPLLQDLVSTEAGGWTSSHVLWKNWNQKGGTRCCIVRMEQLLFPFHISDLFFSFCLFITFR